MAPLQVREKLTDGGSPTPRSGAENLIAHRAESRERIRRMTRLWPYYG